MKKSRIIRFIAGLKHIWRKKWLVAIPVSYIVAIYIIWLKGKSYIPEFKFAMIPHLYKLIFMIFLIEMAVIGLLGIISMIGKPMNGKRIEKRLSDIGFRDENKIAPMLVTKIKDNKIYTYEFYSPSISIVEYDKKHAVLETALNVHIVAIDPGKDMQHIIIKAVSSKSRLPEQIDWTDEQLSNEEFVLRLGESQLGKESVNLNVTPHLLIGGSSGSGKSKLLKLLLLQCIKKDATVYLADFKGGVDYKAGWHERCTMIINEDYLLDQLTEIIETMERRKEKFLSAGCANIFEYNKKHDQGMKRIIVACDEVAEVLDKTGLEKDQKALVGQIESRISTLARQGRAFGIHLLLATQRPDSEILKGQIKNNIDIRICGRSDKVLSQIILDNSDGAEKIPKDKQGMFLTNTGVIFKAFYVCDDCFDEGR